VIRERDLDWALFHAINQLAGRVDQVDDAVEFLAQRGPVFLIAMLLGAWIWPGDRADRDRRQWACIAATISACLALAINQVIIRIWNRPRPFATHQVSLLLKPSHDPSFPSDHATFAFAVAIALALAMRRIGIVALVVAASMAFARVYVGEHYVGDVVAGAVIGSMVAIATYQLAEVSMTILAAPMRLAQRMHLA
jgi:undecaprenyl-diphosphatase